MESAAPAAAPAAPAPVPAVDDEGDVCGICLDELDDDGERGRPEGCDGHFFHADCLLEWAARCALCPLCKAPFGAVRHGDGRVSRVKTQDEEEEEEEEEEDFCSVCRGGGELLICDGGGPGCAGFAHVGCAGLFEVPEGDWFCGACAAERSAASRAARHGRHADRVAAAAARETTRGDGDRAAPRPRTTGARATSRRRARVARGAARDARRAWAPVPEEDAPRPWAASAAPVDFLELARGYLGGAARAPPARPAQRYARSLAAPRGAAPEAPDARRPSVYAVAAALARDGESAAPSGRAADVMRRRRLAARGGAGGDAEAAAAAREALRRFDAAVDEDARRHRRGWSTLRTVAACVEIKRLVLRRADAAPRGRDVAAALFAPATLERALLAVQLPPLRSAVLDVLFRVDPPPAAAPSAARAALADRLAALAASRAVDDDAMVKCLAVARKLRAPDAPPPAAPKRPRVRPAAPPPVPPPSTRRRPPAKASAVLDLLRKS